jgi:hypothetical protein
VIVPVTMCLGCAGRALGLLATTRSRFTDAERHFEQSLEASSRIRSPPWFAWTEHDYARMLLRRGGSGDREKAQVLAREGREAARIMGMVRLARLTEKILEELRAEPPGQMRETAASDENLFRREGDYWTISYRGSIVRLKDSKGLRDIALLVTNPRRGVHVADLVAAAEGGAAVEARGPRSPDGLVTSGTSERGHPTLDVRTRAEYRGRLEELRQELADAERDNDAGRQTRAREEFDRIAAELAAALGLGGRVRRTGSPAERARKAVSERIRYTLSRIASVHPALGRHLKKSLQTGTFCSYDPEPLERWSR